MAITPQNLVRHELIGLEIKIKDSTNKNQKGLKGKVIDETYNTLKIETKEGKEKIITKNNSIFIFTLPNGVKVEVDGKVLISRPEDRIKKKIARW
jgi:ribonuclease P protein subunit POP4